MARMLQALKNLEAKSPRPATDKAAAADKPASTSPKIATPAPAEAAAQTQQAGAKKAETETPPPSPARPSRRPDALPSPASAAITARMPTPLAPSLATATEPAAIQAKVAPPASAMSRSRPPCNFERQVRRTLGDPVRSQPLLQLAERLRRDAEHSASKTMALVGMGTASKAHETLLYAATLLADKAPAQVLLIDANLARRQLSEALECGKEPGLAELLRGDAPRGEPCRPTAVAKLSFLPAGMSREADLSAAPSNLDQVVQRLASNYSFLLIDGGQTGDPSASAVARLADATYFVVQLGTVETSEAQAALRDFRAAGARVLGCIAT